MNATKEDHVSLQTITTHAGARQEALRHDADQLRLERKLHASTPRAPIVPGPGAVRAPHVTRPVGGLIAALRLRLGHALVAVGTALEGGTAEETAPTR